MCWLRCNLRQLCCIQLIYQKLRLEKNGLFILFFSSAGLHLNNSNILPHKNSTQLTETQLKHKTQNNFEIEVYTNHILLFGSCNHVSQHAKVQIWTTTRGRKKKKTTSKLRKTKELIKKKTELSKNL